MGAIHFSVDLELVNALNKRLPLSTFVETGTFEGDTTASVAQLFQNIYTVELADELFANAKKRFENFANIKPIHGSSPEVLEALRNELEDQSVLYWLDAHWCGKITAGETYECPLIQELQAIGKLNDQSVILIDDARMIAAPPPLPHNASEWPSLIEVVTELVKLSDKHRLALINDVFVFVPESISQDMVQFSRSKGLDLDHLFRLAKIASDQMASDKKLGDSDTFNATFRNQDRIGQILAHHLNKNEISRLLDIGSNTGQLISNLRSFGYEGFVYSVEPKSENHEQLIAAAATDLHWITLARQKIGPNCTEKDSGNRSSGSEAGSKTYCNTSDHLLLPHILDDIDAVRIHIQGTDYEFLSDCLSSMPGVKLLSLNFSLGNDHKSHFFEIDRKLVEDLSFSRISLEPSRYDDTRGIAINYDGLYFRPDNADSHQIKTSIEQIGLVTSFGGSSRRTSEEGQEIGPQWFGECLRSWARTASPVMSVCEMPTPNDSIEWLKTESRPSIRQILTMAADRWPGHLLLTNADIRIFEYSKQTILSLDPHTLYYGVRFDGMAFLDATGKLDFKKLGYYDYGFDFYIIPPKFTALLREDGLLPEDFKIGHPWWDYLIVIIAMAYGFPVKKIQTPKPLAAHLQHEEKFAQELWDEIGLKFIDLIRKMIDDPRCVARSELTEMAELCETGKSVKDQLSALSTYVCTRLP